MLFVGRSWKKRRKKRWRWRCWKMENFSFLSSGKFHSVSIGKSHPRVASLPVLAKPVRPIVCELIYHLFDFLEDFRKTKIRGFEIALLWYCLMRWFGRVVKSICCERWRGSYRNPTQLWEYKILSRQIREPYPTIRTTTRSNREPKLYKAHKLGSMSILIAFSSRALLNAFQTTYDERLNIYVTRSEKREIACGILLHVLSISVPASAHFLWFCLGTRKRFSCCFSHSIVGWLEWKEDSGRYRLTTTFSSKRKFRIVVISFEYNISFVYSFHNLLLNLCMSRYS